VNKIGIMQGRLSPQPEKEHRLQFFPSDWQSEMRLTHSLGFDSLEWLIDWKKWDTNPLFSTESARHTGSFAKEQGLRMTSVCADIFMRRGFFGAHSQDVEYILEKLLINSDLAGIELILIPLLEAMHIGKRSQKLEVFERVSRVLEKVSNGVQIAFETELNVNELIDFVDCFEDERVGVYYDIGNCTSYGFDCPSDIRQLGSRIYGIHIKDRHHRSTESVKLGTGDADFAACFNALAEIGYEGQMILQAYRGDDYVQDAKAQLTFVQRILEEVHS
jgi:L-ribulose-5-phosphate 3-epimerase